LESKIEELISEIIKVINSNRTVFTFGNGGSASTADHFAADLNLLRIRKNLKCKAIPLSSLTAEFTAIANDTHFVDVYSNLVESHVEKGDLVISFSASGSSINLLNALEKSNEKDIKMFAIVGFDGGETLKYRDKYLHIPQSNRNYGIAENLQLSLCHYISDQLENYAEDKNNK
jgi:D-sedoheptulose 7-phosphate isomerase